LYAENAANILYAVWEVSKYTIAYDANGGTDAPGAQIKTHGVGLALSNTIPLRGDYTFLGWSTSPNATIAEYSAGGLYTENAAITLYAVWEAPIPPASYITEVYVSSNRLEFYDFYDDHFFIALSGWDNVVFTPFVFVEDDIGGQTDVSEEIVEVKYYLCGVEYDTLQIGELGEFEFFDLLCNSGADIDISIELANGRVVLYSFTYELSVVQPR